jgi:hypothetical protein
VRVILPIQKLHHPPLLAAEASHPIAEAAAFVAALIAILWLWRSDRSRNLSQKRNAMLSGSIRQLAVTLDRTDGHVKLGFVPTKNIGRLRIRLDQSVFAEGGLGIGDGWTQPNGAVIADLRDLVQGERKVVQLTDIERRTEGSAIAITGLYFGWKRTSSTVVNIPPYALYRVRVALLIDDNPDEIRYGFFAVSWLNPSDAHGFSALRLIDQGQFRTVLDAWDNVTATPGLQESA